MKIKALGILEPPGLDRRVYPGEEVDVPPDYATRVLGNQLAEPVARQPKDRAEKRPQRSAEER